MYGETAYIAFAARNLLRNNQPTGAHLAPFYLAIPRLFSRTSPPHSPLCVGVRHGATRRDNAHGVEYLPANGTNMPVLDVFTAVSTMVDVGRGPAAD